MKRSETDSFIQLAKQRFERSQTASQEQYEEMKDDLNFLNGNQWLPSVKSDRSLDGRPCLTINKLPTFLDQIIGDERMNRPQIKIKPVDSKSDKETAEIIQGLIKNIEVQSDANVAYDTAFDAAVQCGFGVFRISSEYVDDDSFDQELRILPMMNQFTAYYDPDAQLWSKQDGIFWFVTEQMTRMEFEKQYPKVDLTMWDADRDERWGNADNMRVAEYFWKEYSKEMLYLYQDKETFEKFKTYKKIEDEESENVVLIKEREVENYDIMWARLSGAGIIEGPTKLKGKYYPIVPVFGKNINIENKIHYRGAVRNAKDSQRLYNYNRSASAEVLSLAPKAPYLLTPKQVKGHQKMWEKSNKRNFTYLLYNPDPMAKGIPQRQPPNPVSTGIQQEVMVSDQELHDTIGLQRASLGKTSNEKSGRAITARQKEGDVGSFQFTDNLVRAMTYCGKVLVDLIPYYYDTARVVRIFNEDGTDRSVMVNEPGEDGRLYDLTVGKYDVVVTVGPSFTTQRQESAEKMIEFIQYYPAAGPLIGDLIAENQDWPGAETISKRLKSVLPPQVLAAEQEEQGQPQQQPQMTPEMEAQAKQAAAAEVQTEMEMEVSEEKVKQERIKTRQEQAKLRKIDADTDLVEAKIEESALKTAQVLKSNNVTIQ